MKRYRASVEKHSRYKGFALPTVLIASVVMIIVLLAAVQTAVSVRVALDSQHYNKLALEAAESGVIMARECIRTNNMAVSWTAEQPLTAATNCQGVVRSACSGSTPPNSCYVMTATGMRTSFRVPYPTMEGERKIVSVQGNVELLRKSNSEAWKAYSADAGAVLAPEVDAQSTRAAHRYWVFGKGAKLDFGVSGNSNPTVSYSGSAADLYEGTTVATDLKGNLLFWTDGIKLFDRRGVAMPNGGGGSGTTTDLTGKAGTTQAAAMFPLSLKDRTYVVVTNSAVSESGTYGTGGPGRLSYSIVNMALNGGYGDVVTGQRNIHLGTTTNYSSEALTAVPNANGDGYWVLTYTPNNTSALAVRNLVAFEIKSNGTATPSVTGPANSGITEVAPTCHATETGFGTLSFNADYTKLLMLTGGAACGSAANPVYGLGNIRVLKFNRATGLVSQQQAKWNLGLGPPNHNMAGTINRSYSADFSPSGEYIYYTRLYPSHLYRYKVGDETNSTTIQNSSQYIGSTGHEFATSANGYAGGGQVKRGPDGRMYVANLQVSSISVVNNPDSSTLSGVGWSYGFVKLAPVGAKSYWGLPQMITYFVPEVTYY